jgi:hypothetical protein
MRRRVRDHAVAFLVLTRITGAISVITSNAKWERQSFIAGGPHPSATSRKTYGSTPPVVLLTI